MRPRTAVIGFGSPLMKDEGVGPRIIAELEARSEGNDQVELLDLGTAGFSALHAFEGRERVLVVDCAYMGEAPGTLRRFTPDQVRTLKPDIRASLHEGDLMRTLDLAASLGQAPGEVLLFGVEPACVEPGLELSPELEARVPDYVDAVCRELRAGEG
jgi:hydrogenase maturation protease